MFLKNSDKSYTRIILLALLLLFLAISLFSMDYLAIDNINTNKIKISTFIENHYFLSVLLFFIACITFINSPVPLAAFIKLLGGFFFGFYVGAVYNILATLVACVVGFGISRYIFRETFEKMYYERLKKVEDDIEKNGFYYILTLRLVMIVPYVLTNTLAGISRISFKNYFYGSALGVIPASLIYANAGSQLEQISSVSELLSSGTFFALVLVALMALLPVINKKLNVFN